MSVPWLSNTKKQKKQEINYFLVTSIGRKLLTETLKREILLRISQKKDFESEDELNAWEISASSPHQVSGVRNATQDHNVKGACMNRIG